MAPLDNTANFDRQAVTASVGTTDPETISVSDASALPDPSTDQYNVVIWDAGSHSRPDQDANVEILRVTARDTANDTITVDRGQENTTNTSHPSSSEIISTQTAKYFDDIETFLNELADFTASPTEVTAPVNNGSVTTGELQKQKHLFGSDSPTASEIGTAMSNYDRVFLHGSINIDSEVDAKANTTLTLAEGATLSFADGASPTTITAGTNDHYLVHAGGVDDFSLQLEANATLDANATNHTNSAAAVWDGTSTTINGGNFYMAPGSGILDASDGIYIDSSNNVNVERAFSSAVNNAVVGFDNCTDISILWAKTIDAAEVIDVNGSNTDCDIGFAIGDNCSQEIVDINTSDRISIGQVRGVNTPSTGVRVGGGNNITINSIVGKYTDQALLTTRSSTKQHLQAHVNAISTGSRCVYVQGDSNDQFNGLRVTGYAESTDGSHNAVWIGGDRSSQTAKSRNIHLDMEVVSNGGVGMNLTDLEDVTANVKAHDCGSDGLNSARVNRAHITAHTKSNGSWGVRLRGSGHVITGRVGVSGGSDELRVDGTDCRLQDVIYRSLSEAGTRTRINGVAQQALGGSAPGSPGNWETGDVVEDTDNAGDAYLKLPSSGFSQIST